MFVIGQDVGLSAGGSMSIKERGNLWAKMGVCGSFPCIEHCKI